MFILRALSLNASSNQESKEMIEKVIDLLNTLSFAKSLRQLDINLRFNIFEVLAASTTNNFIMNSKDTCKICYIFL